MIEIDSWITGHHEYKRIWSPVIGQQLICRQYAGNPVDPSAIGVYLDNTLVGHVPRDIKDDILREIRRGFTVTATVTGPRGNTRRRGLEVPATFSAS